MTPTLFLIVSALLFLQGRCMFIHEGKPVDYNGLDAVEINLKEYTQIRNTFTTKGGIKKFKAQQQYKGVDIFGATLVISTDTDSQNLQPVSGRYYISSQIANDINDDVNPLITADEALKIAINYYIPNGQETDLFGYEWGERTVQNKLNLYKNADQGINQFKLVYIIEFSFADPQSDNVYRPFNVIDAKNGKILHTFKPMIDHRAIKARTLLQGNEQQTAYGTGGNALIGDQRHGPMPFDEPYVEGTNVYNVYTEKVEVYTHHFVGSHEIAHCDYNEGPDDNCEIQDYLINTAPNCVADGNKYADIVFDLYESWVNDQIPDEDVTPVRPENMPLKFYVHYGTNFENAFFSGGAMYFGDGFTRFYPLIAMDVAAHEVAHGYTDYVSGLIYSQQSGGMNEAYSDLAGEAAEAFYRGEADWLCGADIYKDQSCASPWFGRCALRYLMDPIRDGNSIGRAEDFVPNMNVHYSSGVYNKAYYRLSVGAGWTVQEVFTLASYANYYYWPSDSTFDEGLCGMLAATNDLYGGNPDKIADVEWAFGTESFGIPGTPLVVGPGVFCTSNSNKQSVQGTGPNIGDSNNNNDNQIYYIYGGVGVGIFAIFVIVMVFMYYRRKSKILKKQLNGAVDMENLYGAIVTDDERQ